MPSTQSHVFHMSYGGVNNIMNSLSSENHCASYIICLQLKLYNVLICAFRSRFFFDIN